jgi:hypothetical protein
MISVLLLLLLLLCVTDKSHPSLVDMMAFIATIHYDQYSQVDAPLQRGGAILKCDSATLQRS